MSPTLRRTRGPASGWTCHRNALLTSEEADQPRAGAIHPADAAQIAGIEPLSPPSHLHAQPDPGQGIWSRDFPPEAAAPREDGVASATRRRAGTPHVDASAFVQRASPSLPVVSESWPCSDHGTPIPRSATARLELSRRKNLPTGPYPIGPTSTEPVSRSPGRPQRVRPRSASDDDQPTRHAGAPERRRRHAQTLDPARRHGGDRLSRSAVYALMAESRFPKPIRIGSRAVRWVEQEVLDFIASRPRDGSDRPPRSQG